MDEAQAIRAAQQGELAAFNRLVLAYQNLAYNVAYRILGDGDAAADVCQDAFLSAFKGIKRFRGGSFKSWMLRIVTNACYDHLRYQARRPATSLEGMSEDPDYAPGLVSDQEAPEDYALRRELSNIIQQGIQTLAPDQRMAVVLSDVQGFSYQEIADMTGVAVGTVKSRLSRARARLRDLLMDHQELLPARFRLRSGRV